MHIITHSLWNAWKDGFKVELIQEDVTQKVTHSDLFTSSTLWTRHYFLQQQVKYNALGVVAQNQKRNIHTSVSVTYLEHHFHKSRGLQQYLKYKNPICRL